MPFTYNDAGDYVWEDDPNDSGYSANQFQPGYVNSADWWSDQGSFSSPQQTSGTGGFNPIQAPASFMQTIPVSPTYTGQFSPTANAAQTPAQPPPAPPPASISPEQQAINNILKSPGSSGWIGGRYYTAGGPAEGSTTATSGGTTGGSTSSSSFTGNPFTNFSGTNPWMQNVTAPYANNMGSGTMNFASPENPNVNYITSDAAKNLANMFGVDLVQQNTGNLMGGGVSAPLYGLDFGAGDPVNAGQVQFWLNRGDKPADILARMQAGIAPPLGVASRAGANLNYDMANPLVNNLNGNISSFIPGAGKDAQAFAPTGAFQGVSPSTHLGPVMGNLQQSPTAGAASSGPGGVFGGGFPGQGQGTGFGGQFPGFGGFGGWGGAGFPGGGGYGGFGGGFGGGYGGFGGGYGSPFGSSGFQPGSMSGFASMLNGMNNFRRPMLPYQGGGYMNSWYYPGFEPNMRGGSPTYANSFRGTSPRFGSARYSYF